MRLCFNGNHCCMPFLFVQHGINFMSPNWHAYKPESNTLHLFKSPLLLTLFHKKPYSSDKRTLNTMFCKP